MNIWSFDPTTSSNDAGFHGPFYKNPFHENNSFLSGHATVAFAAATVYTKECKDIPGIPMHSYAIATAVTLRRITQNHHWATDFIAGNLLGFVCGTHVVNNYHRYARLNRQGGYYKKNKGLLAFDIAYSPFRVLQSKLTNVFRH